MKALSLLSGAAKTVVFMGYLLLSLFQIAAVQGAIEHFLGWHWIIKLPLSVIIGTMPVIGAAVGIPGAIYGWGWSVMSALLLFFLPYLVGLGFMALAAIASKVAK